MTDLEKEFENYRAEAARRVEIINAGKKERAEKIIEARNQIRDIVANFQKYVFENKSEIEGKKLFLTKGGNSNVLDAFLNKFFETLPDFNKGGRSIYFEQGYNTTKLHITICVSGGKYKDQNNDISTHYCDYIKQTIFDIITVDKDNKLSLVDVSERFSSVYTYETVEATKSEIIALKQQIKDIESKISNLEDNIPSELRNY